MAFFLVKLQLKYDANMKEVAAFFSTSLPTNTISSEMYKNSPHMWFGKKNMWCGVKVLFYKYNVKLIIF